MSSQHTAADYLRQATHYISYATLLHLKRYNSVLTSMAPTQAKDRVHWTDEEIAALVDYLHDHRSEAEGGAFKKQTYQGAVTHIQPLHKSGGPKDATSVKEKFTKVSDDLIHLKMSNSQIFIFIQQIKEHWRVINDYRNRSGVSWDYSRGGFYPTTPNEEAQFREHVNALQPRVSLF